VETGIEVGAVTDATRIALSKLLALMGFAITWAMDNMMSQSKLFLGLNAVAQLLCFFLLLSP
jgi:hypothetical protein